MESTEFEAEQARERGRGLAALVLAVTVFSWGIIIVKLIGLPAPVLAFWRLVIGATTLTAAAWYLRVPFPPVSGTLMFAGLALGAHQLAFIGASTTTSVAIVTLIASSQPLIVAVLSRRTVGERVPPPLVGFSVLAVLGVAVVIRANLNDSSRSLAGDLLAVLNLVLFTAYFLAAKRARMDGAPALTFTATVFWIACAVVGPAMVWTGAPWPGTRQWALLFLLALVPGNGHLLLNWAHARVSAALSSLVLAAIPLLAGVWAHLVLGEPYTGEHVIGMLLVVAAIEGGRRVEATRVARTNGLGTGAEIR